MTKPSTKAAEPRYPQIAVTIPDDVAGRVLARMYVATKIVPLTLDPAEVDQFFEETGEDISTMSAWVTVQ